MTDPHPLVLVVDDYPDAREMYAEWLRVCGYRVAAAGTVGEALELAHDLAPAAILMDLSLPGVDGFEATRQLKVTSVPGTSRCWRCRGTLAPTPLGGRSRPAATASSSSPLRCRTWSSSWSGWSAARPRPARSRPPREHTEPGLVARGQGSEPVRVVELERRTGATVRADSDRVAVEEPLEVRVNGAPFAVIMRTPGEDIALAAGFLLAEDVVRGGGEIGAIEQCRDVEPEARGNVLNVTVVGEAVDWLVVRLGERRQVTTTSACGLCGRRTIESLRSRAATVDGRWTVPAAVVSRLPLALRAAQRTFDATGGVHAAALTDLEGTVVRVAEDVGRHNAVDKIIGRALLDGALPLDRGMLSSAAGRPTSWCKRLCSAACRWWRRCRPPRVSPSTSPAPPASPCAVSSVATA